MKTTISILFALLVMGTALRPEQSRTITGLVTDESGAPLPGVSITIAKSNRGSMTDINGFYSLKVESSDLTLTFSFIGYKSATEKIGERLVINVQMIPDEFALDEMVITGTVAGIKSSHPIRRDKREYSAAEERYAPAPQYHRLQNENFNTEGYATIHENGFKNVMNAPLSTFSIDVDRASYANIRRFINQGQKPPIDAVRIEEMVNYFKYDYPKADGNHPFSVYTEAAICPWNSNNYLLHIGLKGKEIDKSELPASNLVLLIDVSGSMNSPNKLPLLKSAFTLLVNELRPEDRVSIVVYAGAAGVVLPPTSGNHKERILGAIDRLNAGGSTAGGQGIMLAYKLAHESFIDGGNNRIILATDGDFNVGASSNAEMERLIEKERERGIFITVLGFGMGNYKDDKMEIIADKGNGNYAYIDNLQEARKTLVGEFGGTLFTIAKDVKFQVEFNPAMIKSYRLVGYENRLLNDEDFNDDRKDAGEMGAGHTVTAIYELVPVKSRASAPDIDPLKYQPEKNVRRPDVSEELLTIKVRYKRPDESKSILMVQAFDGPVKAISKSSENLRFSAAVAGFGMILRESDKSGNFNLNSVIEMARGARSNDEEGYKGEFIRLAQTVRDMNMTGRGE